MGYYDQLHPWVVYRLLPNCQTIAVARFRWRNDAEMYLIAVRHLVQNARWAIAFDSPPMPTAGAKRRSPNFLDASAKGKERQRN
ncbi:hypothetical protein P7L53_01450 [Thermoleptolyngbya sichuanensis XZ-Cy5]|uniref:hypothetical protein n=1 Tax=Thermoleptolyngbya sichuanensis TaxID=2885951 RepID=UPI00240D4556|nr:hypothetical protein [Thermoleptolyngbya sichuanensis]MDG2614900.1 hypothetical protein [Thermoleptolyngbya sichuanensis XZ-Cy5]